MKSNYNDITGLTDVIGGIKEGEVTVCPSLCDKKITVELSGDFTVPDYLPEIRKLLRVDLIPAAPSRFISGSSVQFSGGAEFSVRYVGADGRIYGTAFPHEYTFGAPFDDGAEYDMNDGISANADIAVESVVGKVNSARRLSLKARLSTSVIAIGTCRYDAPTWMNEPIHSDTGKLIRSIGFCRQMVGCNDDIELHDTVDLSSEDAVLVSTDCGVFLEEIRSGEGYVDCRGSVHLKYLLRKNGESLPYTLVRKLDLSEIVELDGIRDGMACTASCALCGIDSRSTDDGDGTLECTVRLRLTARGYAEEEMSYVEDAYSTVYESSCTGSPVKLPFMSCCGFRNMTFDATEPLESLTKGREDVNVRVIDTCVTAMAGGLTLSEDGSRASASGTVCFNLLYSLTDAEGREELLGSEIELPFRLEGFDAFGNTETASCYAMAVDPRVRITGETLELICEIGVSAASTASTVVERITAVELGERNDSFGRGVTVCYPDKTDSLWSISKRYRVSPEQVAAENQLPGGVEADDPASLEGARYLIL